MHVSRSFACAVGFCALTLVARADNLVTNPNFGPSNPPNGYDSGNPDVGYGPIPGWTQTPGVSALPGFPYLTGSNGPNGVFWDNGNAPGASTVGFIQVYPGAETDALSQTLNLTAGQEYSFSYLENARNCGTCSDPTLTVDLGGSELVGPAVLSPVGDGNFDLVSGTFFATGASEDLSFIVTGTGDATALLTEVNVSPLTSTPEPSSWLLLATGIAGVLAVARKRLYA